MHLIHRHLAGRSTQRPDSSTLEYPGNRSGRPRSGLDSVFTLQHGFIPHAELSNSLLLLSVLPKPLLSALPLQSSNITP